VRPQKNEPVQTSTSTTLSRNTCTGRGFQIDHFA